METRECFYVNVRDDDDDDEGAGAEHDDDEHNVGGTVLKVVMTDCEARIC